MYKSIEYTLMTFTNLSQIEVRLNTIESNQLVLTIVTMGNMTNSPCISYRE